MRAGSKVGAVCELGASWLCTVCVSAGLEPEFVDKSRL